MNPKKILLLGGSAAQVVAIEKAKELGYDTVLCDYLTDNPGQYHADKFYLVSTTDRDAVLAVAQQERVDGVLAYASDPAAPTAAYVAEKMGLPGNPLTAVETLCNKTMFRRFLVEHGFNAPGSRSFGEGDIPSTDGLEFPVIVKPADSSGSKGVTVVHDPDDLQDAMRFAFEFSRAHRVIVEEYIEKAHPYLVGGDVFIEDSRIIQWGLLNCHRDPAVNPLVPAGKSYPLLLSPEDEQLARFTLQKMVTELGYRAGGMNVELVVDKNHRCWLIDVGPRNGGNMIPDLLKLIFDIDIVEMTVKAAMGENVTSEKYFATHNVHTAEDGVFQDVRFSPEVQKYIVDQVIYKKPGDEVRFFNNAGDAIGIVFMQFDTKETMERILADINSHISVTLQ